ncbi:MAG: hypothetical protein JSS82_07490 [Bacteroidetes bacterium]|nr:hypothetical protein [Bacteroidota bacterium]
MLFSSVLLLCSYLDAGAGNKNASKRPKHTIKDKARIKRVTSFLGDLDTAGLKAGDKAPDVAVYTHDGKPVMISDLLKDGVPILIVDGSYSCPRFRDHSPDVDEIKRFYGDKLNVYLIYTLEAHPIDAIGPCSDTVDISLRNEVEDVQVKQAATFGQRKAMADTAIIHGKLEAKVLLDGPKNEFWRAYGPGINNAFLIDTNMVVRAKNTWLNEDGANIWCDLDYLLKRVSRKCR